VLKSTPPIESEELFGRIRPDLPALEDVGASIRTARKQRAALGEVSPGRSAAKKRKAVEAYLPRG
jgi:hypothetical protein